MPKDQLYFKQKQSLLQPDLLLVLTTNSVLQMDFRHKVEVTENPVESIADQINVESIYHALAVPQMSTTLSNTSASNTSQLQIAWSLATVPTSTSMTCHQWLEESVHGQKAAVHGKTMNNVLRDSLDSVLKAET
uniref:Uncharacterized protein n=1 Tax=Ditylenchus dipsaci TaxID=166011 RepID=A0A915EPC5_9BILA